MTTNGFYINSNTVTYGGTMWDCSEPSRPEEHTAHH